MKWNCNVQSTLSGALILCQNREGRMETLTSLAPQPYMFCEPRRYPGVITVHTTCRIPITPHLCLYHV